MCVSCLLGIFTVGCCVCVLSVLMSSEHVFCLAIDFVRRFYGRLDQKLQCKGPE
jgi:hypothetical protein